MINKSITTYTAAGISLLIMSCGAKQQQQGAPPAVPVTVTEVKTGNAVFYDEYPGIVTALNQIELRAQVSGYITGIYFKDGDRVRKGQRLYSIDEQVYSANVQQAQANLQVQETNLLKAQKDADRYHELDRQDAIAKQQVDYADAALEAAKKQVEAARANVNAVQSNVHFASIFAPFDGTIGISQVKKGTSVVAGQTILNVVSTDDPIAVDFTIDQKEIYRFTHLQQGKKDPKDSTFTIAFGKDIYPYNGSISFIDRAVDAQTGTIKVRLVFPNGKKLLKAGMSATVRVLNGTAERSVLIPYKAVTEQLGEYFVYVLGDSNKVSQRKLGLSRQIGADVIVKDGLKEGEKIVVQGVQNLREGIVVTIPEQGGQ
ncbi:efflux RND transporter periplasmic adaptor subunit [Agriterribacter sp.]|uniref:efflux RND transporter periplasmic adaptor subunit n=1 Tax=Agriterribacter sp. TaxID=2821509 RepID=UPI002BDC4AF7|nr:efflux RND transporter periplasmic adaptor subunit [Agriterribacter sp.]HRP57216.1 efflux RND transporter periplasmic adaptor subunit [Agriterribacter sp.]